jgi:parvulin-like peptidyl-prolyl isomerase
MALGTEHSDMEVGMKARRCSLLPVVAGIAWLISGAAPAHGQAAQNASKPAAVVNGEVIRFEDVKALAENRPSLVPLPDKLQVEIYKSALEMLIDDMLMRQFLRKNAPAADQAEVEREWKELNQALSKKQMTLDEFLRDSKQTVEQLKADVATRVQWRVYLSVRFSEADAKAYYQANKVFFDKTFVQASHILRMAKNPDERAKARQMLEVLRQDIVTKKMTFEQAARAYSQCPSKEKGGDIGKFPYKFVVVEPFARAAFAMKVGDVSGIVESDVGMHLIMVTGRIEGPPSKFEEMRETVRETYAQDIELYQKILTEQRSAAKIQRETIEVPLK